MAEYRFFFDPEVGQENVLNSDHMMVTVHVTTQTPSMIPQHLMPLQLKLSIFVCLSLLSKEVKTITSYEYLPSPAS